MTLLFHICNEEYTTNGIRVRWGKTSPANNVKSDPPCYNNETLITRNCVGNHWEPPRDNVTSCLQIVNYYNLSACPPGFDKISKTNQEYCYRIEKSSAWDYPCLKSGGASVITDLNDDDVTSLLQSLIVKNVSQFFWLPARRTKFLSSLWWHIPGPKWGHSVKINNNLTVSTPNLKNCLLLDVQQKQLITETCTHEYPSLCFYINDIHYPAKCPPKYHSVRYMPDEGVCLGIELSEKKLSFSDFIDNKICNVSMGNKNDHLTRFIFKKIAEISNLPSNTWCWFDSFDLYHKRHASSINISNISEIYISINNDGTLGVQPFNTLLPCMACLTEVVYKKTELYFEYDELDKEMYLTIYYPSGLWKYSEYDRGVQCFSDIKGFAKVVGINELPLIEVKTDLNNNTDIGIIEKTVYGINIVKDRAAQYWCEGHTTNFSLIKTERVLVNPRGYEVHVFSLILSVYMYLDYIEKNSDTIASAICKNITDIFSAKKVILMEYLSYSSNYLMVLLHMHITVDKVYQDNARNIEKIYNTTLNTAISVLPKYHYNFVSLASSMYCLPTTSIDNYNILNWELTAIGHIAAPTQFCLQENGLPVNRLCNGSYLLGSFWGNVEGNCNYNYQPSDTTTFLYKFAKGQVPKTDTSRFLTEGLNFVLRDVNIIIPADIYYLSTSLQQMLRIVQGNETSIDMGNIENIAWVVNRVMILNNNYLRLAQTLNSTNVILDSLNSIIEILAHKDKKNINSVLTDRNTDYYQIAVQPQYMLQISYPCYNNVSGIAIIKPSTEKELFTDMIIKPLYINTSLNEVLLIENLEVATWVPGTVLSSLKQKKNQYSNETSANENNIHIIISIFHNDAIFQELEDSEYSVNSRIIGVSIPGYSTYFNESMPLIYRDLNANSSEKVCGFWNFQPYSVGNVPGFWSNLGCYLRKSEKSLTVCECMHLTHFGQLLNIGRNKIKQGPFQDKHTIPLNIISLVGSFLSLLGVSGIWITATVFHSWRKKASTKVLLHLSTSIALPLIFMVVFNLDNTIFEEVNGIVTVSEKLRPACITLGALLHYSVLASFMWMLITAVLQFIRYVRVLGAYRPSRCMIKFALLGWGAPMIPVIVVLALDRENYIPKNVLTIDGSISLICYPSGHYLIVTVIVPICFILFINITLFVSVIYSISKGPDGKLRTADIDLIGAQLRLSIFLFFLLGLTWIFGILSFTSNPLWSYFFCLTSTMQGFILFVYFIILDAQTRNLWITLIKPQNQSETSRKSITSISSN
ncbi:uncharacterized protein LOC112050573 [Bicyclus anynana]|uniref:Uncharacterized protein LOC112050573 n=1 Tax=Bicyclus anynana TaxID=110368 RepID=A0ABM3LFP5_BICAN|nr:uncharacterized protein LOC112050573 [Bicyclus anynana]